jgi:hypothetical protein
MAKNQEAPRSPSPGCCSRPLSVLPLIGCGEKETPFIITYTVAPQSQRMEACGRVPTPHGDESCERVACSYSGVVCTALPRSWCERSSAPLARKWAMPVPWRFWPGATVRPFSRWWIALKAGASGAAAITRADLLQLLD